MAKIEMDISEYEAMKENKKLLEDALSREKELSQKIDKLNQEKIQIMEQNEKSVTIIEEKRINQVKYAKIDSKTAMQIICEITDALRGRGNIISMDGFLHNVTPDSIFDYLINRLFHETTTMDAPPQEKKVVYKGMDEVIDKITSEVTEDLQRGIEGKLERLDELSIAFEELKLKSDISKKRAIIAEKANKNLIESNQELEKEIKKLNEIILSDETKMVNLSELIHNIEFEVLAMNWFNKKQRKQNVSKLIEKWENNESNT